MENTKIVHMTPIDVSVDIGPPKIVVKTSQFVLIRIVLPFMSHGTFVDSVVNEVAAHLPARQHIAFRGLILGHQDTDLYIALRDAIDTTVRNAVATRSLSTSTLSASGISGDTAASNTDVAKGKAPAHKLTPEERERNRVAFYQRMREERAQGKFQTTSLAKMISTDAQVSADAQIAAKLQADADLAALIEADRLAQLAQIESDEDYAHMLASGIEPPTTNAALPRLTTVPQPTSSSTTKLSTTSLSQSMSLTEALARATSLPTTQLSQSMSASQLSASQLTSQKLADAFERINQKITSNPTNVPKLTADNRQKITNYVRTILGAHNADPYCVEQVVSYLIANGI